MYMVIRIIYMLKLGLKCCNTRKVDKYRLMKGYWTSLTFRVAHYVCLPTHLEVRTENHGRLWKGIVGLLSCNKTVIACSGRAKPL